MNPSKLLIFIIIILLQQIVPGFCGCKWRIGATFQKPDNCYSPTGALVFQTDGNMVIYDTYNRVKWTSNTNGRGDRAIFQNDGNFVIYNSQGQATFASNTAGKGGYNLEFGDDRNFAVKKSDGTILWQTNTRDREYARAFVHSNINYLSGNDMNLVILDQCVNFKGAWKNSISSISQVTKCFKLYDSLGCQGKSVEISSNVENLSNLNFNDKAQSASPCGNFRPSQPLTLNETWFEHKEALKRVYADEEVAVYYTENRIISWPFKYLGDVWRYVKSVYGDFGPENNLYTVIHWEKYSGGHPSTYFDAHHDYRNVIDVGSTSPNAWASRSGNDLDIITHEVAHIVEIASKGTLNSPAFGIWGDSKWAEIFIYDVYLNLGLTSEAARFKDNLWANGIDNFPRAGTRWFRDWFYPIYTDYGGSATLNRFFTLLSQHFPKSGYQYARNMNMGEFIHFWSGAAEVNLQGLAEAAFGMKKEWEDQLYKARKDFLAVPYPILN